MLHKKENHITNLIASSFATGIAEISTLPICVLKTNFQTDKQLAIPHLIRNIYQTRGIKGFYSASIPALSAQIISTSGKYTLYRIGTSNDVPKIISGIGSGVVISVITHPLDFIRIALQRGEGISELMNNNGLKTFYRGYSKNLTKVVIGSSLFFPIYDFSKSIVDNPIYASMSSAVISTIIMQPFDYIKTRNIAGLKWYQGMNPIKYFKGCSLNLLRIVPHFTIVMTLTEKLREIL